MIHDIEPKHLYNEWKPNAVPKRSSAVVQFCGRNLLCRIDDNGLKLPSRAMFPDGDERFTYLFELDGREYYLLRDETPREPDGWTYRDIGIFRTEQPKEIAFAAVSAWHLCCWYRDTRFCGRCGTPLEHDVNERMMHCHHMLERGMSLGMEATDLWFDPLFLVVKGMQDKQMDVLNAIKLFSDEGLKSTGGLSNNSNGAPKNVRPIMDSALVAMAMMQGLTSAIVNPNDLRLMETIKSCDIFKNNELYSDSYLDA